MTCLSTVFEAVSYVAQPIMLLLVVAGCAFGMVCGSLPGLSASMAIVLMLPFTYEMEPVASIVETVVATLEGCPSELAGDLLERGIMLAGGGSLIAGLDRLLMLETGLPVSIADDPLLAVAKGTGVMLQELDVLARHE